MNNPVAAPGTTESPAERPVSRQLLLTPEQAAASLAIGRTTVHELLRNGALESVRIGSSRRIPIAALDEYVERLRSDGA